jgi:hypothetical protein
MHLAGCQHQRCIGCEPSFLVARCLFSVASLVPLNARLLSLCSWYCGPMGLFGAIGARCIRASPAPTAAGGAQTRRIGICGAKRTEDRLDGTVIAACRRHRSQLCPQFRVYCCVAASEAKGQVRSSIQHWRTLGSSRKSPHRSIAVVLWERSLFSTMCLFDHRRRNESDVCTIG